MKYFYPIIFLLTAAFVVVSRLLVVAEIVPDDNWPYAAAGLYLVISLINSLLIRVSMTGKASTFLYAVGGASALRFFLSILFIVSYLIISDKKDVPFVILFMSMYFFFTMFELIHLVAKLRAEKNSRIEVTKD